MKYIKNIAVFVLSVFFFVSCNSDPIDKTHNNTSSGSYAAGNSDSTNLNDTLHPAQPNGMDTSGEQTGRMNNTASGASRPAK